MRTISIFLVINLIFCNTCLAEAGLDTLAASSRLGEALPGVERYYSVLALHRKVVELGIESLDDTGGVKCLIFPDRKDARQKAYYYITPDYVLRVSSIAEIDDSFGRVLEGLGRGEDVGEIKPYYLKRYAVTPENRGFIDSCLVQIYPEWGISRLNEILDGIQDLEERLFIDLDNYFDSHSVTGLGDKIRLQRKQQAAAGFISGEQVDRPTYRFTQDGISYAIQFNPGRLKRGQPLAEEYETILLNSIKDAEEVYGAMQPTAEAKRIMDRINEIGARYRSVIKRREEQTEGKDFCPICPGFMPQIEKGFTYKGFVVYPNPFPIFDGHLTLVCNEHKPQQIDKAGIVSAIEFVSSAPDYRVIYNHRYAGASIVNHYHLQAFPAVLPVEEVPLDDISHEDGITLSQVGAGYPARVLVLTGRDVEPLAEKIDGILEEIEDKGQTFNLLFTRLPDGNLRIFIFLRNPKEEIPSKIFNYPFGIMEMAGMIISSKPDYQSLLQKTGGNDELLREEVLKAISKASATDVQGLTLNIGKDGVLVFDVDGTILEKKNTLENEPGMLKALLELLKDGFRIIFISGNSRPEQLRRVWWPIKKGLIELGALDKAKDLIIYANGGATKISFDNLGNEILDSEYNRAKELSLEDLDIIRDVLNSMLTERFGLTDGELREWRRWLSARNDFPNIRFDSSWAGGVPVIPAEDITAVLEGKRPPMRINSVWIETRDGAQVSIKLLPRLPRDIRMEVIRRIESELEKRGCGGRLIFRKAGFASIDINRAGIDKSTAVRDLEGEVVYFGDEFGEGGNDLPVLEVPGVKVFSVGPEGPEATKRFLRERLEGLRFKEALGVLGVSKKELRLAIERFMGVKDIVGDQRIPEYRVEAEERARKALRQAAVKLAGLGKPLSEITQDEFNSILGVSQVVLAGGFASRYHMLLHKGLGHMEISGDTNMRLAMWGSYKSPGAHPVFAIGNRLILWLLKDEIIEELINSGKDIELFMIGKLQELGLRLEIRNGVIQKGVVIPDSIIDPDKKALFFTSDADIIYFHHYGYGDAFCDSLMTLKERGVLDKTRFKQYVFSEMSEAGLQDRSAASFIAYLEAVADDNLITMGPKEVDPKTQANDILTKKGNLFLEDGKLIAFTDAPDMPRYRKERLREVLRRLEEWERLSPEEKAEIRREFAVTENGKILISANCGVFRNDITDYFGEYYQYDEDGNKPGFVKIEVTEDGQRIESHQIDPKTGEPVYIAPDLVEAVSRVWQRKGLNIHDLPIGYVNTGNAPSSIKDMNSQREFNARWLGYVGEAGVFLGRNADGKIREEDIKLLKRRKDILRKQLFYTAIMGSRNYRVLLDIFNGDRDLLRKTIDETARYLSMEPVQVLLGILGSESFYSLGLKEDKEEKSIGNPHVVTLSGGTAIGSFLLEAIHKLGLEAGEGELLIASLLPTLDDGGSTYEIITNLDRHGYGIFPPLGDQANVLLAGLVSLDKVRYILGDSGRVRDDGEESLENILVLLLKRTFNDTTLQKSPDLLYFASNILAASRIIDEYYIRKGILNLKGASIRNLFVLAILHEYGLLKPDKSFGGRAIEGDAKITSYNDALRALSETAGVKDGIVVPVSFDPATMYARYEDNVLIWSEPKNGSRIDRVILIKPGPDGIRVRFSLEEDPGYSIDRILNIGEEVTIDTGVNSIKIVNRSANPLIIINEEKWLLNERGNKASFINITNPLNKYILANDGSGRGMKIDETEFHPLSIGGLELYIRPRLVVMQTNITETANFSRLVEVGLLDRFRTGKPAAGRSLHANPMAVRLIEQARDMIIIGPGNIFTSILPHLMVPDIVAALKKAKSQGKRVVWIMNGTIDNETVGLTVSDIIAFMERVSGEVLESIFTDIIFTSYDKDRAEPGLRQAIHQRPVLEVREPGTAAREGKKSRGPLVPTPEEIEQIRARGIVVHQDELLRVKEVRDRATGRISYRITQDPDKMGAILKRINEENISSREIREDWEIISFDPEERNLQARVRYYGKGILLGELHIDIDPIAASINTCYLRSYREGQGLATEMVARAYCVAYYISQLLEWNTQWAHAYFTLSDNEEREADYWPTAKWKWMLEERPEVRIIEKLGLVRSEVQERWHYNDRRCPLADMEGRVSEVSDLLKKRAVEVAAGLVKARDSPTDIRLAGSILPWVGHSDAELLHWARGMVDSGLDMWHIDIMDGEFVPNTVDARDRLRLLSQKTQIPIEIYMMVKEPTLELIMDYIKAGLRPGRDTILVHLEAFSSSSNLQDFLYKVRGLGLRINLAINPKTPVDAVRPYLYILDRVTIMGVEPGLGGQEFINYCLGKIRELRGLIEIEVDGGVDEYNRTEIVEAGARVLTVGADLAKIKDPGYAIWRLKGGYLVFQGPHQMFVKMDRTKLKLIGLDLENFGILDELINLKEELDSRLRFTEYPEQCDDASEQVKGILEKNGFKNPRLVRRENFKLPEGRIGVVPHHHQYVEVDIAGTTFIIDLTADQFEVREFKPAGWKNEYYDLGVVVIPKDWVEAHKDRFWMYTSGTQAPILPSGTTHRITFNKQGEVIEGPDEARDILAGLRDIYGIGIFAVTNQIEVKELNIDTLEHALLMAILRLIEPREDKRKQVIELMRQRRMGVEVQADIIDNLISAIDIYGELLKVKRGTAKVPVHLPGAGGLTVDVDSAGLVGQSV